VDVSAVIRVTRLTTQQVPTSTELLEEGVF